MLNLALNGTWIEPKILVDKVAKILESKSGVMINYPKANPIISSGPWDRAKSNKNK